MATQTPATPEIKSDSGRGPVFPKILTFVYGSGSERKTQNPAGVDSGNPDSVSPLVLTRVEHDPVPGSRSNRILQFRTGSGLDWISQKLNRIGFGYPNCIDHCMLTQSFFSDINRIGSNIWTGLPD